MFRLYLFLILVLVLVIGVVSLDFYIKDKEIKNLTTNIATSKLQIQGYIDEMNQIKLDNSKIIENQKLLNSEFENARNKASLDEKKDTKNLIITKKNTSKNIEKNINEVHNALIKSLESISE